MQLHAAPSVGQRQLGHSALPGRHSQTAARRTPERMHAARMWPWSSALGVSSMRVALCVGKAQAGGGLLGAPARSPGVAAVGAPGGA
jgi:hypothetical protein